MQYHMSCPNDICDGEVTFDIEMTDDGAADIYGPQSYYIAWINDEDSSHVDGCYVTTYQSIRTRLEEQAMQDIADDPNFGFVEPL
jgi:hypothetical protein